MIQQIDGNSIKSNVFINVRDYGVIGDGITDDTIAIQAIIDNPANSGRQLYFPKGTYKVTGTGLIFNRWMSIKGESKTSAIIKNYSTTSACITLRYPQELFTISDIAIMGNGTNEFGTDATSSYGILIDGAISINIDNVWMRYHGDHCITGTHKHINNINITNSEIGYSKKDAINFIGDWGAQVNAFNIINNNIARAGGNGISIWGSSIVIEGNTIQGNAGVGVSIYGLITCTANGIAINYNYFELNGLGHIKTQICYGTNHINYIIGCSIIGNYGSLEFSQVTGNTTALVSLDYLQIGQESIGGTFDCLTFNNPAMTSNSLNILDAHNCLTSNSEITMPSSSLTRRYVNLGHARIKCLKKQIINGYFYAKGITYDLATGKSTNITSNTIVYFPCNVKSYENIGSFFVYCETDSTKYSVKIERLYRAINVTTGYTSLSMMGIYNQSGSYLVGANTTSVNNRILESNVDQYFKITIILTVPGTYFYLGNPSYSVS